MCHLQQINFLIENKNIQFNENLTILFLWDQISKWRDFIRYAVKHQYGNAGISWALLRESTQIFYTATKNVAYTLIKYLWCGILLYLALV